MKKHIPLLHNGLPFFLFFLINFSVQGQPPPPGYKHGEVVIVNSVQKHNLKEPLTSKGPHTDESFQLKESMDKIYKTFLAIEDNLRVSNSEKAKVNANNLLMLLTENMKQRIDNARFEQIKANAKLICATNDLKEQRHYCSLMSKSMHQLLHIK